MLCSHSTFAEADSVLLAPVAHPARSNNLKRRSGRPPPLALHRLRCIGSCHDVPQPEARGELQEPMRPRRQAAQQLPTQREKRSANPSNNIPQKQTRREHPSQSFSRALALRHGQRRRCNSLRCVAYDVGFRVLGSRVWCN